MQRNLILLVTEKPLYTKELLLQVNLISTSLISLLGQPTPTSDQYQLSVNTQQREREREFQINDNTLHVREYFFYIQLLDVAVVGTLKSE